MDVMRCYLANRDARLCLTSSVCTSFARVHRLDQITRNIPANLFDSKSFTLKPAGRTDWPVYLLISVGRGTLTLPDRAKIQWRASRVALRTPTLLNSTDLHCGRRVRNTAFSAIR